MEEKAALLAVLLRLAQASGLGFRCESPTPQNPTSQYAHSRHLARVKLFFILLRF